MRTRGWRLAILVFAFLLTSLAGPVRAPSGTFYLGYNTTSDTLWSSPSARHVTVTVTETNAAADTYADTTASSLTVRTDNKQIELHNGETGTIDDVAATFLDVSENPGYDHNGYAYYGMGGTWEVTVLDSGTGTGGGPTGGSVSGVPSWGWIAIAVVVVAVAIVVALALLMRRPQRAPTYAPYPPPAPVAQAAAVGVCPNCRTPFGPGAAYCATCGTRLA